MTDPKPRKFSLFAKPLKGCVESLVRPVFKAQGAAASKLAMEWSQIVGREMAAYTAPTKLTFAKDKNNEGTLTIACEGAHALTFQHMQPVIIERIASYFGYRAVARISIEQRPLSAPAPKKTAKKLVHKNVDISCLDDVKDSDLHAAFSSLAKTLAGEDNTR